MADKCKLIDQATFEILQQSTSNASASTSGHKVRNAKYKRMKANRGFDLMLFVKATEGNNKVGKRRARRFLTDHNKRNAKKKGKQRETGAKKAQSRLKKSILRYREIKKAREQQLRLEETTSLLQELTIVRVNDKRGQIHSRRFREYCSTCTTPDLKKHTEHLLRELNRFQRRAHALNEIKAKAHPRFVVGFRQVQNYLRINKVRLVIVATDCEKCDGEEVGLDQTISAIKTLCHDQHIPIAFPFERRKLAYILFKKASISCVGILDYDGARDVFSQLLVALKLAQESYEKLTCDPAVPSQSTSTELVA